MTRPRQPCCLKKPRKTIFGFNHQTLSIHARYSSQINTLIPNRRSRIGRQVLSVTEKEEVPVRPVFWVIFTPGTQRISKVQSLWVYEQSCPTLFSGSARECSFQQDLGHQLSSTICFRNSTEERKTTAGSQGQISSGHPTAVLWGRLEGQE